MLDNQREKPVSTEYRRFSINPAFDVQGADGQLSTHYMYLAAPAVQSAINAALSEVQGVKAYGTQLLQVEEGKVAFTHARENYVLNVASILSKEVVKAGQVVFGSFDVSQVNRNLVFDQLLEKRLISDDEHKHLCDWIADPQEIGDLEEDIETTSASLKRKPNWKRLVENFPMWSPSGKGFHR